MGYTGKIPAKVPLTSDDIVDGSITNADIADLDAAKLTGTVVDARISALTASKLSGVVPAANLGTGTASSTTVLYGDGTYKAEAVTADEITKQSGAPTISNPATPTVGDLILATSTQQLYVCQTVSVGANVWKNIGDGTGGISPIISASGGTTGTYTYDSVDYTFHKFLSTGAANFVVSSAPAGKTIDVLVVAGGGGGSAGIYGQTNGGGAGAGGYRWFTAQTPSAATYVSTVGAGGAGGGSGAGAKGSNSSFIGTGISITATGGGTGGYNQSAGGTGGCGGGSSGNSALGGAGNEGSYTPVEGFGGNPTAGHNSSGSGGGGMGAVGVISISTNGGAGGNGVNNFLNQSSTAFTTAHTKALLDAVNIGEVSGSTRYIGGGGTGGHTEAGKISYGGLGGGGDNPASGIGTSGDVNTGSGGAGNGHDQTTNANGAGGSGMILVRYLA
jgi:hypothetical protein